MGLATENCVDNCGNRTTQRMDTSVGVMTVPPLSACLHLTFVLLVAIWALAVGWNSPATLNHVLGWNSAATLNHVLGWNSPACTVGSAESCVQCLVGQFAPLSSSGCSACPSWAVPSSDRSHCVVDIGRWITAASLLSSVCVALAAVGLALTWQLRIVDLALSHGQRLVGMWRSSWPLRLSGFEHPILSKKWLTTSATCSYALAGFDWNVPCANNKPGEKRNLRSNMHG